MRMRHTAELCLFALLAAVILSLLSSPPVPRATAQSASSWNTNVLCSSTVTTLLNVTTPSQGITGSPWQINSKTGGVPSKRSLSPPCSIKNINGQNVSSLVQINGVYVPGPMTYGDDCAMAYAAVNGLAPYPNGAKYCDSTVDIHPVSGSGTIHIEFDRDWMAKGYCGPGRSPCDNNTITQYFSSGGVSLDVQGFVFWDNGTGSGHWELHPFTAWRLSSNPQPLAVSVSCGTATAGKPVTCNASATGGVSPYTFTWSAPSGNPTSGTGSSFTTTYANKGTFVVNATVTDSNNSKKSTAVSIVVAAQPLGVAVSCGMATAGKPVSCTSSATGGTSPYTFSWSAPSGSPATGTGSSFTTTYATKGTFTVNATVTDANNVKKSQTANVAVAAQSITVTVICSSATAGKPVTCSATSSGGTSPYSFSWSAKDGSPSTGTGASFTTTYATKGTNLVNATVTDSNGAKKSGTASVAVAAQSLTVTLACGTATAGKPVTCNASATGGTSPYTFSWASKGTPATGPGSSYTTTFATKGSQTVNATTTDNNGVSKLGQLTISVAAQPTVLTVTCGTATAGKPVTCNASATGGTVPYAFSWSAPGGSPATGTGASLTTTYTAKGTYTVNATVSDANNLKASAIANVIVVAQPIVLTVTCGPATAGSPVTCNASATGGTSPYTMAWASLGSPNSALGTKYTVTFNLEGSYGVNATVTDVNSATSNSSLVLTVFPKLVPSFSASRAPVVGYLANFTGSASGGTAQYISYSWNFGDGTTGNGTNPGHVYSPIGVYNVTLTVTDSVGSAASVSHTVQVWKVPDITGTQSGVPDGRVDILDVAAVAFHYGARQGDVTYDPSLDMNGDGVISILDVALVAFYSGSFGW